MSGSEMPRVMTGGEIYSPGCKSVFPQAFAQMALAENGAPPIKKLGSISVPIKTVNLVSDKPKCFLTLQKSPVHRFYPAPKPTEAKAHAGKVRVIRLDQIQRQTSGGDFTINKMGLF